MKDFGNQVTNYGAHERAPLFYNLEHIRPRIDAMVEALRDNPESCVVPKKHNFQVRGGGTRRRCSTRALVAYALGHTIPLRGYGTPSCGMTGCVNPAHQTALVGQPTDEFVLALRMRQSK
jgi:hypothetical protein